MTAKLPIKYVDRLKTSGVYVANGDVNTPQSSKWIGFIFGNFSNADVAARPTSSPA